ncbi:unnamed protein product [Lactuca saligna]|uniref:Uncharacterized protein n=1 Tax=Lactuca saligna TaxID=75948 RepID=A0AA35VT26_LACSI|nr:unnamed protein product [Lactuca saligna]
MFVLIQRTLIVTPQPPLTSSPVGLANAGIGSHQSGKLSPRSSRLIIDIKSLSAGHPCNCPWSSTAIKEAADRTVVEIELPRQQAKGEIFNFDSWKLKCFATSERRTFDKKRTQAGCLNTTLKMTYFRDGFMKYVEKRVFSYWGFVASGLDRQF